MELYDTVKYQQYVSQNKNGKETRYFVAFITNFLKIQHNIFGVFKNSDFFWK